MEHLRTPGLDCRGCLKSALNLISSIINKTKNLLATKTGPLHSVEAARYLSFRFGVVEVDPDQTPASLLDVLREAGQFSIQRISKSSSTVTVNEGGGFVDEFILSLNALKLNVRTIEKSGGVIHHVSVIGYENHFSLNDYPILNLLADMLYDGMSSGVDLGELDWPEFCQASAENGATILSRKHLQSEYFKLTEDLIELMGQR